MDKMISIIVPVYNVEKYLEKCINSILGQTYENLELILINDGSNDGSEAICQKYINLDKRIKFITQENYGVSVARNRGLEIARGSYLLFVDSDDWLERNACQVLVETINKFKVDVVIFEMQKHYESGKVESPYRFRRSRIKKNKMY